MKSANRFKLVQFSSVKSLTFLQKLSSHANHVREAVDEIRNKKKKSKMNKKWKRRKLPTEILSNSITTYLWQIQIVSDLHLT